MRRIFVIVVVTMLPVFTLIWSLQSSSKPAFAMLAAAPPPSIPPSTVISLEVSEMGGDLSALPFVSNDVKASAAQENVYVMPNYVTVSDLLPRVVITRGTGNLGAGYYFVGPWSISGANNRNATMIVNDRAQLVYYQHTPGFRDYDFKVLKDGTLSYFSDELGGFSVLDDSYAPIELWQAGNGYPTTDPHDLELLTNGNVALMIYNIRPVDLSASGGQANSTVIDLVIQELDPDHNVVFEWNSRDHFLITDTYVSLSQSPVDYVHGNAIEEDNDGNFLISSRHMSEITKIDRTTGAIIWRLGGKNNQFAFVGDTTLPDIGGFSFQHDIRRLPNGHITIFDNANQFVDAHLRGSRGVEYAIDEVNKKVTLVREFRTNPDTYAGFMGKLQRLPNGNTVVGWGGGLPPTLGQAPALTEFTPQGAVALTLAFDDPIILSYRAYKFPWHGFPTTPPVLTAVTESSPPVLYYSWNGATDVVSYSVYGGETPVDLKVIAQQPKTDFEDSTALDSSDSNRCFFQVKPAMIGNVVALASKVLYLGDASCANAITGSDTQTSAKSFTYPQSEGNVTSTLTIFPGAVTSPTIFVYTPDQVKVAAEPSDQVISAVRFGIEAFRKNNLKALTSFEDGVRLTIDYGALDLAHSPAGVVLLRWDEATKRWTGEGLTLLQRDDASQQLSYALHRPGEFALFAANEPPQSAPVTIFMDEDTTFTFSGSLFPYFDSHDQPFAGLMIESVPVSGSLTYSGTPIISSQVITPGNVPLLVFAPEPDEFGLPYASFDFSVSDGFSQSVPYSFTIAVRPVNDAPVATDDQADSQLAFATTPEVLQAISVTIDVLANDFDVDGDVLKIISTTKPAHGKVAIANDQILYTSTEPFKGIDTFTYTIDDSHGEQATATVSVPRNANVQYFPRVGKR